MKHLCYLFLLLYAYQANAQLMGFKLPKGKNKVEIPFEFTNNFIVINVTFNEAFPLKFIFDTGSENTILIKKEFTDILNISYDREFKVVGSDYQTELTAYLARGVDIDLPNLPGPNLDLLVLDKDYFKFEEFIGMPIHGILGMDLFKVFTIEIDYSRKMLILHKVDNFKVPNKRFTHLKIDVHRNKAYLTAQAEIKKDSTTDIRLLLDTGASLALLLHNDSSNDIILPEKLVPGKIGNGLSGIIEGFVGRISTLNINKFKFNNVITNFQEVGQQTESLDEFDRNGIMGNEILSRFTVIFDLSRSNIYFKPIKRYNRGFKYDKSGLLLIASGKNLKEFIVKDVMHNSPAAKAGILEGDKIKKLNLLPAVFYDLRTITQAFQKRTGKKFRLVVERGGVNHKFKFRLRDLI